MEKQITVPVEAEDEYGNKFKANITLTMKELNDALNKVGYKIVLNK